MSGKRNPRIHKSKWIHKDLFSVHSLLVALQIEEISEQQCPRGSYNNTRKENVWILCLDH